MKNLLLLVLASASGQALYGTNSQYDIISPLFVAGIAISVVMLTSMIYMVAHGQNGK